MNAPTLADANVERRAALREYATARRAMSEGRTKAAEAAVSAALDHEREADRLELLARRDAMSATETRR